MNLVSVLVLAAGIATTTAAPAPAVGVQRLVAHGAGSDCRQGYSCKAIGVPVCVRKGKPEPHLWAARRAGCTAYVVTVSFRVEYDGTRVDVVRHSLHCRPSVTHVLVRASCHVEGNGGAHYGYLAVVTTIQASRRTRTLPYQYQFYVDVYVTTHGRVTATTVTSSGGG